MENGFQKLVVDLGRRPSFEEYSDYYNQHDGSGNWFGRKVGGPVLACFGLIRTICDVALTVIKAVCVSIYAAVTAPFQSPTVQRAWERVSCDFEEFMGWLNMSFDDKWGRYLVDEARARRAKLNPGGGPPAPALPPAGGVPPPPPPLPLAGGVPPPPGGEFAAAIAARGGGAAARGRGAAAGGRGAAAARGGGVGPTVTVSLVDALASRGKLRRVDLDDKKDEEKEITVLSKAFDVMREKRKGEETGVVVRPRSHSAEPPRRRPPLPPKNPEKKEEVATTELEALREGLKRKRRALADTKEVDAATLKAAGVGGTPLKLDDSWGSSEEEGGS